MKGLMVLFLVAVSFRALSEDGWKGSVERYCLDCHDKETAKGDLNLEGLLGQEISGHSVSWEKAVRQLEARQMPPIGKDRPDEEGYQSLVSSLVAKLDLVPSNPGRTDTIRRLTRTEYQNAIRDLLALEIDAADLLPGDEASHGFDNITVGNLSPALLDRYLGAAQKISRLAVGMELSSPDSRTIRIAPDLTQEEQVEGLPIGTRGGALVKHNFPRSGEYEIRVRLTRDRNEMIEGMSGTHEMEFLLDRDWKASLKISPPKNRKDNSTFDSNLSARFHVAAGAHDVGVTFAKEASPVEETLRQPYEAHFNLHRHPRLSPAIFQVTITGPLGKQEIGGTPSRERIFRSVPGPSVSEEVAARENLSRLMRIAGRRPVESEEIDRMMEFFQEGRSASDSFDGGMESALSAILVSRGFLFRIEKEPQGLAPGTPYRISDFDIASRLSFFLWSSLPDDELLAIAGESRLHDPVELEKQARRMLSDPRSESLVKNFANQWLYLRNLDSITPDGRLFPDFDHNLRTAFKGETELLFAGVIREDRTVLDLLKTKETFLNERLAKHYGIPHIYGSRFRKVMLEEGGHRGGLLRHGSILTVTSYATRTSPVIRGNWILENFLGTPPPPPPPNVPALDNSAVSASLPIRERLAAHREKAVCASCHNVMDPIGFALENFDAVGQWRETENGAPVDAKGGMPSGVEFVGVTGLEQSLLKRPDLFVRTLVEKLMTFALGRGVEPSDAKAIRKIVREAETDDFRFSKIITGIVRSDPFTMRMSE